MTMMIGELYNALTSAGADEAKARSAAAAVASYENRLGAIERKIDRLDTKIDAVADRLDSKIDSLEKRANLMFGIAMAINVATLGLVLRLSVG